MDRRRGRATLQPLASVLTQTLHQAGLDQVALLARLLRHWDAIAGTPIATVARPERLRGRVLFVAVTDAVWLQQLTFYQRELLGNIHRVLGDVPIAKLHFVLAQTVSTPRSASPPRVAPRPLTPAEERDLGEQTATIADAELREAVRRAWRRGLSREGDGHER